MPLYMECKNGHRYDVDAHDGECPRCRRGEISRVETMDEHLQRRSLFRIFDSISAFLRANSSRNPVDSKLPKNEPVIPAQVDPQQVSSEPYEPDTVNRDWLSRRHFQGMSPRELESERQRALRKTKWLIPRRSGYAILAFLAIAGAAIALGYYLPDIRNEETLKANIPSEPFGNTGPNPTIRNRQTTALWSLLLLPLARLFPLTPCYRHQSLFG